MWLQTRLQQTDQPQRANTRVRHSSTKIRYSRSTLASLTRHCFHSQTHSQILV